MSADDTDNTSTGDDTDSTNGGPGRREVAHRLFAAEFDDASLSYSESDEERAPNYVVTPTGARVNRLFAVGVLTAVEAVNEETLRARIADPTGAFVSYAGQYQPDEMAFLDRTTPPAFLALTGKARTFEPEDSDRVFTSVRPESINEVDGDTRDRWVVETARATLDRVRIFADALDTGLTGDDLRAHLESQGVPAALAEGIPLAIDHYGTTPAYLEAVRTLAVETLEVVADERDEASALDIAPDEGGDVEIGPLPAGDTDLSVDVDIDVSTGGADSTTAESDTEIETETDADDIVSASETATGETTGSESSESADVAESGDATGTTGSEDSTATTDSTDAVDTADSTDAVDTTDSTDAVDTADSTDSTGDTTTVESSDTDGLGDFDAEEGTAETGADDLGDFGTDEPSSASEGTASETASSDDDTGEVDDAEDVEDIDDVLDDETREAVKSEHGVGFSTGNEVDEPGEAGIDVPDADELEEMAAEADAESATADEDARADTESATADTDDSDTGSTSTDTDDADTESTSVDPDDVDLESAVLDAMKAEDGGNGAPREDVISAVVAEYGVPEEAVEDAIQEALMSGLCYEASDGLKPI
jgi:hypothetical protein